MRLAEIRGLRGTHESEVDADLTSLGDWADERTEVQAQASISEVRAVIELVRGNFGSALKLARRAYELTIAPDGTAPQTAMRAAAWLRDPDALAHASNAIADSPGRVAAAIRREGEAGLAAIEGRRSESLAAFLDATRRWRDLGLTFEAAVCELSLVTMLGTAEPEARAAADDAAAVFDRLGAQPLVTLLEKAMRAAPAVADPRPASARAEEASVKASD